MYEHAEVTDLHAFLLGIDRPIRPGACTDNQLLAVGNTKRPLIRHTRRLALLARYRYVCGQSAEERMRRSQEAIEQTELFEMATKALYCSPVHEAMPRLEAIQAGKIDFYHTASPPTWMMDYPRQLGPLVMRQIRPRFWCQADTAEVYQYLLPTVALDWHRHALPELFTTHAITGRPIRIMWGTANVVNIVDDDSCTSGRSELRTEATISDTNGLLHWIFEAIEESLPCWRPGLIGDETHKELDDATTVTFYGVVRPYFWDDVLEMEETGSKPQRTEQEILEVRGKSWLKEKSDTMDLQKLLRERCKEALGGSTDFWERGVTLKTGWELSKCPACGDQTLAGIPFTDV